MRDQFIRCIKNPIFHRVLALGLSVSLLFSALALSPSFGWFSQSRQAESGAEMRIDGDLILAETFDAYKYFDAEGQAKKVTGNDITLPVYDSVFTEKNENSTLVYRVPVFGAGIDAGNDFTVTLSLRDLSGVTGLSDHNFLDGNKTEDVDEDAVADYISNVIYINCAVIADLQDFSGTDDALYQKAHAFFTDGDNASQIERKTFVTAVADPEDGAAPYEKTSATLTFSVEDYSDKMADTVLYVFLEVGYDEDLVAYMIETRDMTLAFDEGEDGKESGGIEIKSDLNVFRFEIGE